MTRRDFLTSSGLCAGGLLAASTLPSFADDSALFPGRGRWERLSIVGGHVKAGANVLGCLGNHEYYHGQKIENEATSKDYKKWLKAQPLLKAILAGHQHISISDRFSPTCTEYLVGGNFLFHGAEITID